MYWSNLHVSHLALFIPFLGVYTTEPMGDINWSVMAFGLLFIYHFIPLQVLGMVSSLAWCAVLWSWRVLVIICYHPSSDGPSCCNYLACWAESSEKQHGHRTSKCNLLINMNFVVGHKWNLVDSNQDGHH